MSNNPKREDKDNEQQGMNIDVGHLSVTGHVIFAGRDGSVNVTTGGDVEQTASTSLTVGGVETTREEYDGMVSSLIDVQKTIEEEPLEPNEKEAAEQNLQTIETQLTAERAPNSNLLIQATKALYRSSPLIAGQLISLFSNPLVGQIIEGAGEVAIKMRETMMRKKKKQSGNRPSKRSQSRF